MASKLARRVHYYLKYEFRDIAWPRPLPDPPDYDASKKPWSLRQWLMVSKDESFQQHVKFTWHGPAEHACCCC